MFCLKFWNILIKYFSKPTEINGICLVVNNIVMSNLLSLTGLYQQSSNSVLKIGPQESRFSNCEGLISINGNCSATSVDFI